MATISSPDTAATSGTGREFWRGLLTAGGSTAIPRWSLHPMAGVAGHEAAIPDDLAAALRRRADELAVPLGSVLLAAHAKVLAALSGEPEGGHVLRRAGQLAAAAQAELIGVYVRAPSGLVEAEPVWLEGQRRLLAELGGRYAEITGADVAMAILDFAHAEHAARVVLGSTRRTRAYEPLHCSVIGRIISRAGLIEVHLVPAFQPPKALADRA